MSSPCGDQSAFIRDVLALHAEQRTPASVRRVTITRQSDGSHVLELERLGEVRTLTDPECETLFRAAVVIAATWSEPLQASEAVDDPSLGVPSASVSPSEAAATDGSAGAPLAPSAPAPPARREATRGSAEPSASGPLPPPVTSNERQVVTRLVGGGGIGAFTGLTPSTHWGVEVLGALAREEWRLELALRALPPKTWTFGDFGVRQSVWGARIGGSFAPMERIRTGLGMSGYWLEVEGTGNLQSASDGVPFWAPEAEFALAVVQGQNWSGEIAFQGRMGLNSPRFVVAPDRVAFQLPRWGVAGLLRILWTDG